MKTYIVATFCEPGEQRRSKVEAYLRDYNESWERCRLFEVMAYNGKNAKEMAISLRLCEERKNH